MIKSTEIVFGLYGGNLEENIFNPQCLIGTLFPIGNDFFITAGHVLKQAVQYENVVIGVKGECLGQQEGSLAFTGVGNYEIIDKTDIGIIRSYVNKRQAIQVPKWSSNDHYGLDDVYTFGFPFGLNLNNNGVYLRSLKGFIVSSYQFDIPNYGSTGCYEISIHCPKGISGAPLFSKFTNGAVIGIIIGNSTSEIEISYKNERIQDSNQNVIHQKTEAVKYGIAIKASEIMNLDSKLLGTSIRNHLKTYDLLIN